MDKWSVGLLGYWGGMEDGRIERASNKNAGCHWMAASIGQVWINSFGVGFKSKFFNRLLMAIE